MPINSYLLKPAMRFTSPVPMIEGFQKTLDRLRIKLYKNGATAAPDASNGGIISQINGSVHACFSRKDQATQVESPPSTPLSASTCSSCEECEANCQNTIQQVRALCQEQITTIQNIAQENLENQARQHQTQLKQIALAHEEELKENAATIKVMRDLIAVLRSSNKEQHHPLPIPSTPPSSRSSSTSTSIFAPLPPESVFPPSLTTFSFGVPGLPNPFKRGDMTAQERNARTHRRREERKKAKALKKGRETVGELEEVVALNGGEAGAAERVEGEGEG